MRRGPTLGWLLLALLLGGCAGMGISGRDASDRWALSGKLGVRQEQQAESVLLNWTQCGERYRLVLSGPFGQRLARVEGNAGGATLWLRNEPPQYTTDIQLWLTQHLGWPLPVAELRYWVRGRAMPGVDARVEHDQQGLPRRLWQRQWQVDYLEFHHQEELTLPRRLRASRDDLSSTLLIKQWQLGEQVQTCPTP